MVLKRLQLLALRHVKRFAGTLSADYRWPDIWRKLCNCQGNYA